MKTAGALPFLLLFISVYCYLPVKSLPLFQACPLLKQ